MMRAVSVALVCGLAIFCGALIGLRVSTPSDGATIKLVTPSGATVEPLPGMTTDLHDGDIVQAINGVPIDRSLPLPGATAPAALPWQANATLAYTILRNGQHEVVAVHLRPYALFTILLHRWTVMLYVLVIISVSVALRVAKPDDPACQHVFWGGLTFACGVFCFFLGEPVDSVFHGWSFWLFQTARLMYLAGLIGFIASALLVFRAQAILWLRPLLRHPLIFASIPFALFAIFLITTISLAPSTLHWLQARITGGETTELSDTILLSGVAIGGYLANHQVVIRHYFRWSAAFAIVTGGSIVLLLYVPFLVGKQYIEDWNILALLAIPFPLMYAFVILRQRIVDMVFVPLLIVGCVLVTDIGVFSILTGYVQAAIPQWPMNLRSGVALAVALGGSPLFVRFWQRNINWLLYGDRDDPSTILARLGQRLELIAEPTAIFPVLVETIAQVLRLPYVALRLKQGDQFLLLTANGQESRDLREIDLRHHSETIGQLVLARPRLGGRLTLVEQRLLEGLAQQAAHVIYSMRVTADLQLAREHLVTVREEERRRLMNHSAHALLSRDPAAAERILVTMGEALEDTSASVRQLVYNLRPPKLDDLGLVGAIRAQGEQAMQQDAPGGLVVHVLAPDDLGPLSPAVEVALYRIALEALTNVIRHAQATQCDIILRRGERIGIEVCDDGAGIGTPVNMGVGVRSMRERAEELGGTFAIEPASPRCGTRVVASFPLVKEASA